ncbi:MarR family winged helix-turn-helix transcriptional regulator [Plantactinospora sp. WMMB334]|uniref:MarR family winged helix-turn-helix transcriptional regulator n=1 Tax=Plantactinospora sp. WMMB334 TaxID=3404119 RepID=UPI003B924A48
MNDDERDLISLLRLADDACERHRAEVLDRAGCPDLNRALIPILRKLIKGDASVGALAAEMRIPMGEAARRVNALEARGYVRRCGPAGDIRHRVLRITAAGRTATEIDRQLEADLERQVVARLGASALDIARQVFAAIIGETGTADDGLGQHPAKERARVSAHPHPRRPRP